MLRYIFNSLIKDIKIFKLNKKYKSQNVDIRSYMVDSSAKLGKCVRIEDMATIVQDVSIGDYSFVGVNSFVGSAKIGNYCSIGRNVTIGGYEHPLYDRKSTSPMLYRRVLNIKEKYNDIPAETIIGNDVWIGNGTFVRGGGAA